METKCKKPRCGPRPIITMLLHVEQEKHRVQVLLDTGCSVPLVNKETAQRLQIPVLKHDLAIRIENYRGITLRRWAYFIQNHHSSNTGSTSERKLSK